MPDETTEQQGVPVTCHHCGYVWVSKSELILVNCPSCGKKTPRVKEEKK